MSRTETPAWATKAICPVLGITSKSVVLDPYCGAGDVLRAITPKPARLVGFEVEAAMAQEARGSVAGVILTRNALAVDPWTVANKQASHVVSHPPFVDAVDLATRAMGEVMAAGGVVAMLVRLNWMAGRARVAFHRRYPSDVYVLAKRIAREDLVDFAWFVWHHAASYRWTVIDASVPRRNASKRAGKPWKR